MISRALATRAARIVAAQLAHGWRGVWQGHHAFRSRAGDSRCGGRRVRRNRDLRRDRAPFAEWNGRRYEDRLAAANWALKLPRVTAQRACIVGVGYGGYQAMLAATRAAGSLPFAKETPPGVRDRAADAHARILLIHHTDQWMSTGRPEPIEARALDNALRRANKSHRLAPIDGIDDVFEAGVYRELPGFLESANS